MYTVSQINLYIYIYIMSYPMHHHRAKLLAPSTSALKLAFYLRSAHEELTNSYVREITNLHGIPARYILCGTALTSGCPRGAV